jgi:hypothetical protein
VHQVGPKDFGSQNISILVFKGEAADVAKIYANGMATARDRRKKIYRLNQIFQPLKVLKRENQQYFFLHFSHHETNTSLIFHLWQVKYQQNNYQKRQFTKTRIFYIFCHILCKYESFNN